LPLVFVVAVVAELDLGIAARIIGRCSGIDQHRPPVVFRPNDVPADLEDLYIVDIEGRRRAAPGRQRNLIDVRDDDGRPGDDGLALTRIVYVVLSCRPRH